MDRKQLALIAAICGAVVFVGVLLPWVSVNMGQMGSATANGTEGGFDGGVIILILGIVGAAAAALAWSGNTKMVPVAPQQQLLIGTGALAVAALLTVINFFKDFGPSIQGMGASRGIGLYLTLLASLGGTAAMVMLLRKGGAGGGGTA
jgi:hypothetical protein